MKVDAGKIVELVRKMKPLFADSSRVSQVKEKGTCDYVTQVDIQVQKLVKEGLYSMYPQVQCMGEEQDKSAIDRSGDFWILDPVDGTTNLIHDFRHSTLSLAYAEAGEVVLGIVSKYSLPSVNENSIASFVKLRNNKTHSGTVEWGESAKIYTPLFAIVYASFFKYIKLPDEVIKSTLLQIF